MAARRLSDEHIHTDAWWEYNDIDALPAWMLRIITPEQTTRPRKYSEAVQNAAISVSAQQGRDVDPMSTKYWAAVATMRGTTGQRGEATCHAVFHLDWSHLTKNRSSQPHCSISESLPLWTLRDAITWFAVLEISSLKCLNSFKK